MKPLTREWINKAEGDWIAAGLLFRARRSANYDTTCFHAQQSAEKYLKARLEGRVSEVINGKRAISKAQAKAMAEFFHVSAELFI